MESGVSNEHLKSLLDKHNLHDNVIGKQLEKDKDGLQNDEFDASLLEPCALWEKPVSDFKLEYVDLDEFLTENGIPADENVSLKKNGHSHYKNVPKVPSECPIDSRQQENMKRDRKFSTDLVLEAISEEQSFDPASHSLLDEELKPQEIGKKSCKQFVPEEFKDEKYWARRRKNNLAAKRSREARRVKENQIVLRASYLEKENIALREEIKKLIEENCNLLQKVKRLESK